MGYFLPVVDTNEFGKEHITRRVSVIAEILTRGYQHYEQMVRKEEVKTSENLAFLQSIFMLFTAVEKSDTDPLLHGQIDKLLELNTNCQDFRYDQDLWKDVFYSCFMEEVQPRKIKRKIGEDNAADLIRIFIEKHVRYFTGIKGNKKTIEESLLQRYARLGNSKSAVEAYINSFITDAALEKVVALSQPKNIESGVKIIDDYMDNPTSGNPAES